MGVFTAYMVRAALILAQSSWRAGLLLGPVRGRLLDPGGCVQAAVAGALPHEA